MQRTKGNTAAYISLMLRSRTVILLLPVICGYILLTIICFYYREMYMQYPDVLLDYVTKWCHQVIPMLACWWALFLQNQFVSGEGNELLYLYLSHKEILKCQLVAMAAYGVWICMYIGGMQFYFDMNLFFLFRICLESVFIGGAAFLLVSIVRNTGIPILFIMVYCMYVDQLLCAAPLEQLSQSLKRQEMSPLNMKWAAETLILAAVFHIGGFMIYKQVKKYE